MVCPRQRVCQIISGGGCSSLLALVQRGFQAFPCTPASPAGTCSPRSLFAGKKRSGPAWLCRGSPCPSHNTSQSPVPSPTPHPRLVPRTSFLHSAAWAFQPGSWREEEKLGLPGCDFQPRMIFFICVPKAQRGTGHTGAEQPRGCWSQKKMRPSTACKVNLNQAAAGRAGRRACPTATASIFQGHRRAGMPAGRGEQRA